MVRRITLALTLMLLFYFPAFAEESITITTYYPSPYGSYNEVTVYRDFFLKDQTNPTTGPQVTVSNRAGNFVIDSTSPFYQLMFADENKPFCYLQRFTTSGTTMCANGYVAVNFLDNSKIPASADDLPSSGYIVCLRGWE